MHVLIAGAGGLGTVLAAHLARGGAAVSMLVKPARAAAFEAPEVTITGAAEFSAPVRVVCDAVGLPPVDYLVVCVKGRDSAVALDSLAGLDVRAALSLQNGVLKDDLLVERFGRERVLGAVSGVAGTLLRPGTAFHPFAGRTLVGELDGTDTERSRAFVDALRIGGLPAANVSDIGRREWYKLAGFLRTALVCALVRHDIATVAGDPDLARVCASVARDVAAVAAAEGRPLWQFSPHLGGFGTDDPDTAANTNQPWSVDDLVDGIRSVGGDLAARGAVVYPSLAQDAMAGRPTELDFTAGDVLARAARHKLDVPALETCVQVLRGLERSHAQA